MATEQDDLVGDLTYREWHAFVNGFYAGTRWGSRQHDYTREHHYWRAGYLIGTGTRYSLLGYVYHKLTNND